MCCAARSLWSKLAPESAGRLFDLKELIHYFESFTRGANLDVLSPADTELGMLFNLIQREIPPHKKMLEATDANDTFYTNYKLL